MSSAGVDSGRGEPLAEPVGKPIGSGAMNISPEGSNISAAGWGHHFWRVEPFVERHRSPKMMHATLSGRHRSPKERDARGKWWGRTSPREERAPQSEASNPDLGGTRAPNSGT